MANDRGEKRFGSMFGFSKHEKPATKGGLGESGGGESAPVKDPATKKPVVIVLDQLPSPLITITAGVTAAEVTCSDGRKVLRFGSGNPSAFPGGTPAAVAVRVPDAFEKDVAGNRVRVSVSARAASPRYSARFASSYSTNEVGNSGWVHHTVGPRFETKTFEWAVPPMRGGGGGDFVGILPAAASEGEVEVASIEVEVLKAG